MSNPMTCSKGHFYPATMSKCPFCEREGGNQPTVKTEVISKPPDNEDDKTRPVNVPGRKVDPTGSPASQGDSTRKVSQSIAEGDADGDRTIIHRPKGAGDETPQVPTARRKLEGWLVSFTMDPAGVDFRLYEGRNAIGRGSDCDIKLINDQKISAKHALIVFRGEESVFADEFASNPSFINGERIGLGDRMALKDGASIKMGEHEFIFRKVKP